ncbi:MAG: response regulator transcription factor [Acutalibacteraceae bacterium]
MFNILVVEDNKEIRELFCTVLQENGFRTFSANDGIEAFDVLEKNYIDLIISDIMMPNFDGYELIKQLRATQSTVPVLMITAKGASADKKEAFRLGADDYMVKPIDVDEMVWRVEALLRRSNIISQRTVSIGSTVFDFDTLTAKSDTDVIELPQKEFLLMFKLIASPGRIFTRIQLMNEVWGVDSDTDSHTLDVHISRLRERFRNNRDFEIVTVRGLGYKVVKK